MAEISKDFSDDQSRFQEVLFQRGRKVIDGELNDAQRVQRVAAYRTNMVEDDNSGDQVTSLGIPRMLNFEIVPTVTNNEIQLQPVTGKRCLVEYRGYIFEFITPVTFITEGTGSDRVQEVTLSVVETEVSGATDPSIVVAQLGETARRVGLALTFQLFTTASDPTTGITAAEPWEGGTKRCLVARIQRLSAIPDQPITVDEVFPQWKPWRSFAEFGVFGRGATLMSADSTRSAYAYVDQSTPDTLVLDNMGMMMGPGNYDVAEDAVMRYDVSGSYSMPNPGDCLVLYTMTAPRAAGTPSLGGTSARTVVGASAPTPEQVQIRVENWANYTTASNPPNEEGYDQRLVIAVREDASTGASVRYMMGDGRTIRLAVPTTTPLPGEGILSWRANNALADVHLAATDPPTGYTFAGKFIPFLRTRSVATDMILLSAHKMPMGGFTVYERIYLAQNFSVTGTTGLTLFSGLIRTVNARFTGVVNAEWTVDEVTATASAIVYDGAENANLAVYGSASRSSGAATTWDKNLWDNGSGLTAGVHYRRAGVNGTVQLAAWSGSTAFVDGYHSWRPNTNTQPVDALVPIASALYAANIPKFFCKISIVGGVATVDANSFGVASVSYNAGSGLIQFTLHNNWAVDTEYVLSVTPIGDVNRIGTSPGLVNVITVQNPSAAGLGFAGFEVRDVTTPDTNPLDPGGGNATAAFAVVGFGLGA